LRTQVGCTEVSLRHFFGKLRDGVRQLTKRVAGVATPLPEEAAPAAIAARASAIALSAIPDLPTVVSDTAARAAALERIASHLDASSGGITGGAPGAAAFWGDAAGSASATVRAAAMGGVAATTDRGARAALQAGGAAYTLAAWLAAATAAGCTTDMVTGLRALEALVTAAPLPPGGGHSAVAKATRAAAAALGLAPPPGLAIVIAPPPKRPPPLPASGGDRKRVRDRGSGGGGGEGGGGGGGGSRLGRAAARVYVPPAPTPPDFAEPLPWSATEAAGALLAPPFALRTAAAGVALKRRAVAAATKRAAALACAAVCPASAAAFPPPPNPAVACSYPIGTGQGSGEAVRLAKGGAVVADATAPTPAEPPASEAAQTPGAPPPAVASFAPTAPDEFEQLRGAMAAQGVRDARMLDWGQELVVRGR